VGRGGHFAVLFVFFSFLCGKKGGGREEAAAPQAQREAAARLHETGHSQPAAPCPTVRRRGNEKGKLPPLSGFLTLPHMTISLPV